MPPSSRSRARTSARFGCRSGADCPEIARTLDSRASVGMELAARPGHRAAEKPLSQRVGHEGVSDVEEQGRDDRRRGRTQGRSDDGAAPRAGLLRADRQAGRPESERALRPTLLRTHRQDRRRRRLGEVRSRALRGDRQEGRPEGRRAHRARPAGELSSFVDGAESEQAGSGERVIALSTYQSRAIRASGALTPERAFVSSVPVRERLHEAASCTGERTALARSARRGKLDAVDRLGTALVAVEWEDITAYTRTAIPEDFEQYRLRKLTCGP